MSEHAAGGEAEVQRLAAAMAAERTTAAERMALTAVIVMAGAMLGLGRVGGGSGWLLGLRRHGRWRVEGTAGCGADLGDSPGLFGSSGCVTRLCAIHATAAFMSQHAIRY